MKLSAINVYPVKSLAGIARESSLVERRGLELDRRWMLVDEHNKFLTQREFPKMATIETEITDAGLRVSHAGRGLEIPLAAAPAKSARVRVWSSVSPARVYDDSVNEWFSDVLEMKCRLVVMPEETRRRVSYFYRVAADDHVSFADAYPFLLIGEGSLEALNARLEKPVPMNRFRPNLVVAGAEPFAEDSWKTVRVGATVFHVVKPCARCVMTTIEQATGEKQGTEPLRTLAKFRTAKRRGANKILFGQNLIAAAAGAVLRVGDEVEVLETKRPPKLSANRE